jgi:hypothetical protein
MNTRSRSWRRFQRDRVIKNRMKNRAHNHVDFYRRGHYYLNDPVEWYNNMGKYIIRLKTSSSDNGDKYHKFWGEEWKDKYHTKRARLKEEIRKRLYDEIGERYHIKY